MHITLKNWRDFLTRKISIFSLVPNMTSVITKQLFFQVYITHLEAPHIVNLLHFGSLAFNTKRFPNPVWTCNLTHTHTQRYIETHWTWIDSVWQESRGKESWLITTGIENTFGIWLSWNIQCPVILAWNISLYWLFGGVFWRINDFLYYLPHLASINPQSIYTNENQSISNRMTNPRYGPFTLQVEKWQRY